MASTEKQALENRLSVQLPWKGWLAVFTVAVLMAVFVPRLWWRWEGPPSAAGYRIPHRLSSDYWLFRRHTALAASQERIVVLGDSVVWGEYVRPSETLTAVLNGDSASDGHLFSNGGVTGMHPLAMSGLVSAHGGALRDKAVVVHCNLLWLSSPQRDLRANEVVSFNHAALVPQFTSIPSYRAPHSDRLRNVIRRNSLLFTWVDHLRAAHFDDQDLQHWSMAHPYQNPFARIRRASEPPLDKLRHKAVPWHERGITVTDFDWAVDDLGQSLQWQGFLRTVKTLRKRRNRVLVLLGPLNVHMLKPATRQKLDRLRSQAAARLANLDLAHVVLQPLPSDLYADASHPLAEGYIRLGKQLQESGAFRAWLR